MQNCNSRRFLKPAGVHLVLYRVFDIKSKKQTDEKKINLKLIKTNSYKLKSITGLSYVF